MPVVSVDRVREHLNMVSFQHDDELAALIEVAETAGERYTGRVFGQRTCVDTYVDPPATVVLSNSPIDADSVVCTVGGVEIDASVSDAGVVSGTWGGDLVITYTAGYETQPATDVQGVLEMIRHLWATQRGQLARVDDGYTPATTYSIPRRVQELWGVNVAGGFA